MKRRMFPLLSLFLLSPLVGEYLLGSLPMSLFMALPIMAAMYGSGAILIREIAVRSGGNWVTITLLSIAYGLIEEGFVTQSLFNPNYLNLRLLDSGFIPALGTGLPWLLYVISIHVIWSISIPIGLTESIFPNERNKPWLGWVSTLVFCVLYLAGSATIAYFTYKSLPFMASNTQFIVTGMATIIFIVLALMYPRLYPHSQKVEYSQPAPNAIVLLLLALITGILFMLIKYYAEVWWHWTWQACLAAMLVLEFIFVAGIIIFTRNRLWTNRQRFGLVSGGALVYGIMGIPTDIQLHGAADLPAHMVLVALFALLLVFIGWRTVRAEKINL